MSHYTSGPLKGKPITMWNLIPLKGMPPTRKARYCCAELKESKGKGRVTVTGVRWEESLNRRKSHGLVDLQGNVRKVQAVVDEAGAVAKDNGRNSLILNNDNDASRKVVEQCFQKSKTVVNPIIDWTEEDVWEFLNDVVKVPHCELYDLGWTRLGCIGCPMANVEERRRSFEVWPKYKQNYIRAFQRMIDLKKDTTKQNQEETPPPEPPLPAEAQAENGQTVPPPYTKRNHPDRCQTGQQLMDRWQGIS